jgi:3-hydroxyisobutyrate dehydrogenase
MIEHNNMQASRVVAMRVGFIGVGAIWLPMAEQIRSAGHFVTAVDSSSARLALAAASDMQTSESLGALRDAEIVIIMVATGEQLMSLVSDPGLPTVLAPGALCIVMSTVGPRAVKEAEAALDSRGIGVLDVPVSGGVAGAKAARLALFASGSPHLLARARAVLSCLGREWECGTRVGDGQAVKLVNQLLCSVNLVAAAEALAFARKVGLDPAFVLKMLNSGAAASWMLGDRGPRMLENTEVEVSSSVDIFIKDSGLVLDATKDISFKAPLIALANERLREAGARGLGPRDDSRVVETYL